MIKRLTDETFGQILSNAVDITDTFDVDLGGLPDDILQATQDAKPHLAVLRSEMEKFWLEPDADLSDIRYGLIDMAAWTRVHGEPVKHALTDGDVGAIDGTPVVPHQRYLTAQVYACAVGYLTSRTPMDLSTKLFKTQAPIGTVGTLEGLIDFISEAEILTGSRSWPAAFMEYLERERAKDCASRYVVIDGPIVTQNLLTRRQGRDLLRSMLTDTSRKCYVGVIKDILRSSVEMRFYARALKPGELYVQETLYGILLPRLDSYGGDVSRFVSTVGTDILRGVFRPGRKAFGFECHRDKLPDVVSLLWLDQNDQPGNEIPFLQAQVDAQLRGRYRPAEAVTAIEATLSEHVQDEFFDEINERMLR
jgi:hypothetical protein